MRRFVAVGLAGLAAATVGAQGSSLDLEAAVALALQQNPALQAVEERRREVAGGVTEARADAFPQLAAVADWSRSRNPALLNSPDFEDFVEMFPGGSFEPGVQELYGLRTELSQALWTAGKVGAAVRLAKSVAELTEYQIATARLDTALASAEAFYGLLAAQQALRTVEIQEQARREALAVVRDRLEIGEATRLELLQAEAALAEVRPAVSEIEGLVAVAESRLRGVLGLDAGTRLEVREEGATLASPPRVAELLRIAGERRPELEDLRLQQETLGLQRTVIRADGRPQLDLFALYGREVSDVSNLSDPLFDDYWLGLTLRWEFFDGGKRKGQILQLDSRSRQLEWQLRDLWSSIRVEVEQSLSEYETARARWQAAKVAASAAREANRVAKASWQEGVGLQADWLNAQEREIESELRKVRAFYDGLVGAARVSRAIGLYPSQGWKPPPAQEVAER